MHDVAASVLRPDKELRGFTKVSLEPGETKTVEVALGPAAFAFWDTRVHDWRVEAGRFEILVGSSSADIRGTVPLDVVSSGEAISNLSEMSPLQDWLSDGAARESTIGLLRELAPVLGETFGEAAVTVDALDPHFHSYFGSMPIRGVLEFAAPSGGPDPDAKLAELAGAVRRTGSQRVDKS